MIDAITPYFVRLFLGCIVVGAFWAWVEATIIDKVIVPQAKDVFNNAKNLYKSFKE